jgi:D-beta-D-heptose 7-phosphate kinase/D-beta-D-heptose 1-phosphate adenosyltransferase
MNTITSLENLLERRARWKRMKKTVALTNGCFDILHLGHIHLFHQAKMCADILVVAVNDDASVRRLKGPFRPIFFSSGKTGNSGCAGGC